jgi:hypothetical protein
MADRTASAATSGQVVDVHAQGEGFRRVAERRAHVFEAHSAREEFGCEGVSKVVKPYPGRPVAIHQSREIPAYD